MAFTFPFCFIFIIEYFILRINVYKKIYALCNMANKNYT